MAKTLEEVKKSIKFSNTVNEDNNKSTRIVFIEPNDVYDKDANGQQHGLALTPKYEDFCISFNLIIETFNRLKSGGVTSSSNNGKNTYKISWGLTREDMQQQRTSVLQGDRGEVSYDKDGREKYPFGDNYNFLTTYYTDLTSDSYRNQTEIEGLGVESVQISYESWYTPTVTIKFIDVRGSALFGREEAIHDNDKITSENVFGAFFTMPYPLFRLQVKGFLGKPVTYQLTCSGFKGELNSQTGNFEAVATFLGYSWSLLTDIPFAYLVAAPYAPYIGRDYWERQCRENLSWRLWDDDVNNSSSGNGYRVPMKLYDLFANISAAIASNYVDAGTQEQRNELTSNENEINLLNAINKSLSSFIDNISTSVSGSKIILNDGQYLFFLDGEGNTNLNINDETKSAYTELYNNLQTYKNSEFNSKADIINITPNEWGENIPNDITFLKIFTVTEGNVKIDTLTKIEKGKISEISFNEKEGKLTKDSVDNLFNKISENNNNSKNPNIKNCCYLIDTKDIGSKISIRKDEIRKRNDKIDEDIKENINLNIIQLLSTKQGDTNKNDGFKPFIGNIFKTIFCHLETFCHIMFDSAHEIYRQKNTGERSPKVLGIDLENTDFQSINNIDYVTPWPAIFNNGKISSECGYVDLQNQNAIYGWVGDLREHKFIEEKVVYALQEGIQKIVEGKNFEENAKKYSSFPILPSDYSTNKNVFGNVFNDITFSDLAGHLATRITNIIGVLCGNNINEELSTTIGRLDAYNLYYKFNTTTALSALMDNKTAQALEDIMFCRQSGDEYATVVSEANNIRRHKFETKFINNVINNVTVGDRHPYFLDESNNEKALFIHYYGKNNLNYSPSSIRAFNDYLAKMNNSGDFKYYNDKDEKYFKPVASISNGKVISNGWLYFTNSVNIDFEGKDSTFKFENYYNKYMFDIITDGASVSGIRNKYLQISSGSVKIGEYEVKDDLSKFVNTFLKVGDTYKARYFNGYNKMLSANIQKLGIDTNNIISEEIDAESSIELNYQWFEKTKDVTIKDNCEIIFDDSEKIDFPQLVIQDISFFYCGNICSLFGCPFYYLQNSINDIKIRTRVKALLFLHSFRYEYNIAKLNVFKGNKTNGATEEVPKGYLLFLRAMLWRKRQDNDPIVYKIEGKYEYEYESPGKDKTLFYNYNGALAFNVHLKSSAEFQYNYLVSNLFDGLTDIDYNIENQLIDLFINFADKQFTDIANRYELKRRNDNGSVESYTIDTIVTDINYLVSIYSRINPEQQNETIYGEFNKLMFEGQGFTEWQGKYMFISINKDLLNAPNIGLKMLMNENDIEYQKLLKDLYFGTYIITDNCQKRLTKSRSNTINDTDKIYIKKSLLKSYLKGFKEACEDIISNEMVSVGDGSDDINISSNTFKNRDLSLAIYYYLKNLWDKWLVISNDDAFDVKTFFNENFIFIDSFYKNIYHYLAINCEQLLTAWTQLADNGSLFHFLSRIVSDHGCIFLPVPDYIGFNGEGKDKDIKMMEDLFRPLPYNSMDAPSNSNKFIIMYTHSPSHIKNNDTTFKSDSYILRDSYGNFTKEAIKLFAEDDENVTITSTNNVSVDNVNRYGYNVPSFGVSFARQNNHIFKNLRLTMDNPVMTEQAIKAQWQIALKGSSHTHSICFIGQDTFNVFSNYSYSIDIEMLGNAQICPLMYFQLNNVPMWRGTYMIYKVIHNMTPGNMTTTVTAMKMSRFSQPFNTSFFTVHKGQGNENSDKECLSPECCETEKSYEDGAEYGTAGIFSNKSRSEKERLCGINDDGRKARDGSWAKNNGLIIDFNYKDKDGISHQLKVNKKIVKDLEDIINEINELGWFDLNITNCWRLENTVKKGLSKHCYGIAVDINPFALGNPWFNTRIDKNEKEPEEGRPPKWDFVPGYKKFNITYNSKKCIWHWGHPVVKIFMKHGWGWGGRYGDTMHFSVLDGS